MYWGMGAYGRKKKLTAPELVVVDVNSRYGNTSSNWTRNSLTMQCWLKHLQDIFNYREIDYIWFARNSSQFDIDDIKEVFGNTRRVVIGRSGCYAFNQMILQNFFSVKKLSIAHSSFPNSKVPGRVLMLNFEDLDIGYRWVERTILSLDELLLINSKKIYIDNLQMSAKELNKFIKLWQRGSNPRMEWLAIKHTIVKEDDKEAIIKGIKHEIFPSDYIRKFRAVEYHRIPREIKGGIDIVRVDGMKATIRFKYRHSFPAIEMFVWFDHCVVDS
ncbi:hypothetical protein CAEBREN_25885 [Caenorhabditis brenneri]|uniref:Sdz-33 F-box domain-containing protein n=1 Tax=Caenorhabditis brenneri TaxID=135651 RepID=G0N0H5_CAEBE|nr:hypothetical protein CAEBREN_25885 [Caenorhabditis brenneri]